MGYGTAEHEFVESREGMMEMASTQTEQLRNMNIEIIRSPILERFLADGTSCLIVEEFDMHNLADGHRFSMRLSTILEWIGEKWLVTHFHASTPDSNVAEEESLPMEGLRRKNQELEAKIKERTRELEIEASLERVRAVAMGMMKPDDMLEVCLTISQESEKLGIKDIRNVQTVIVNEQKGTYVNYQYFTAYDQSTVEEVDYHKHPTVKEMALRMLSEADAFFSGSFEGEELEVFRNYRKQDHQFPDPLLDEATTVDYYFYSIGPGGLGFSTYKPLGDEGLRVFKRFHKVFSLAYRRFLDIQKAEAQAREAQIEAAVERVRAQSMAMYQTSDLYKVNEEMLNQLHKLRVDGLTGVSIYLVDYNDVVTIWDLSSPGNMSNPNNYSLKYDSKKYPILGEWVEIWKTSKLDYFVLDAPREKLIKVVEEFREIHPEMATNFKNAIESGKLKHQWNPAGRLSEGILSIDLMTPPTEDIKTIVTKMAGAFNLAYQRFLDLQKAEIQAREAQIEAALERIRSRTLIMHFSAEVGDVSDLLFSELEKMNINPAGFSIMVFDRENDRYDLWRAKRVALPEIFETYSIRGMYDKLDLYTPGLAAELEAAWKSGKPYYISEFRGKRRVSFIKANQEMAGYSNDQFEAKKELYPDPFFWHQVFFKQGWLGVIQNHRLVEDDLLIIRRFAEVFEFAYTRFLDLKKAEAQARESQIELALERVRARTMAMHKSEELKEVIQVVYEQFVHLNIHVEHAGFIIDYKEKDSMHIWLADKHAVPFQITIPYFDCAHWNSFIEAKGKGLDFFANLLSFDEKNKFYQDLFKLIPGVPEETVEYYLNCPGLAISTILLENVGLYIENFSGIPYSAKENITLMRFGRVFQQTYTRFLDLQKAEAQAREAQIEASLERVRSKTMAMRNSQDVGDTVAVMFDELVRLGIETVRCGIGILFESMQMEAWTAKSSAEGKAMLIVGRLGLKIHPLLQEVYHSWISGDQSYSYELRGEDLKDYFRAINNSEDYPIQYDIESLPSGQFQNAFFFSEGALFAFTDQPMQAEASMIFKRFAGVFGQTYTRFLDLQKAEAQAREAIKRSSLDRVRGQIASMRSARDLEHITPIIWNELKALDVPFIRCGVFFVDNEQSRVQVYLTTPDVKPLGVLSLPIESGALTANAVDHWRKGLVYTDHWNKDQFIRWTQSMLELGQIQNKETYQGSENPPEALDLYFVPFTQGMLYVGNTSPLSEELIQLIKSLADAFSIAYARYEDFNKLEKVKESIEATLTELKSTQAQLIQAEKMASLGELTAGIAHEIQNPLNFVNNFSEVSQELVKEMNDELVSLFKNESNWQLVKEIAADIEQNLEKINHHGRRADAIVKGMLQHSRNNSGVKELTDINALADEYLRLTFHGLRAKDKSFNADFQTDFDESLPKINVIPQDIGRVLLNLINNAFYAVDQRAKTLSVLKPTVTVSTRNLDGQIQISVQDNGTGIPDSLKDKIFQPFFTTKPTGQGTGLGLSLSYDIVKAHGGDIQVNSTEREGTTFILSLPHGY
jgi:signal transduction histidine kinase